MLNLTRTDAILIARAIEGYMGEFPVSPEDYHTYDQLLELLREEFGPVTLIQLWDSPEGALEN